MKTTNHQPEVRGQRSDIRPRASGLLLLCAFALMLLPGCSLVVCNHAFPKLTWAFSREAIECRKERQMEKQADKQWAAQQATNSPAR